MNHGGVDAILAYIAAAVVAVWGVAHAVPTRQVLAGFELVAWFKICPALLAGRGGGDGAGAARPWPPPLTLAQFSLTQS